MSNLVIDCQNLGKVYKDGKNKVEVLKGVNLQLEQGQMLAIVGSSGSGKSTLLHILGTLDQATTGHAKIKSTNVAELSRNQQAEFRNKHMGFIYQFHHLLMEFTALENVAMPLLIQGEKVNRAHSEALSMLEKVGLGHRAEHKPSELSGGERQRVAIALGSCSRDGLRHCRRNGALQGTSWISTGIHADARLWYTALWPANPDRSPRWRRRTR